MKSARAAPCCAHCTPRVALTFARCRSADFVWRRCGEKELERWSTACKTRAQQGPKLVASQSDHQQHQWRRAHFKNSHPSAGKWAPVLGVHFRAFRALARACLCRARGTTTDTNGAGGVARSEGPAAQYPAQIQRAGQGGEHDTSWFLFLEHCVHVVAAAELP